MVLSIEQERSSIKPDITGKRSDKEVRIVYSTAAYDSYREQGFEPPEEHRRPDKREVEFLLRVDPAKGKVRVRIDKMVRVKAPDHSTEKHEMKDYLYFITTWYGKNWMDHEVDPVEHTAGKYLKQTKRLQLGDFDPKTGAQEAYYVKGMPIEVYDIPFNKTNVDKILFAEHPFGPDSINITDPPQVKFYAKFDNTNDSMGFRCGAYTYEQFVTPEWKHFFELATRKGGPAGLRPGQGQEPDKDSFIK